MTKAETPKPSKSASEKELKAYAKQRRKERHTENDLGLLADAILKPVRHLMKRKD